MLQAYIGLSFLKMIFILKVFVYLICPLVVIKLAVSLYNRVRRRRFIREWEKANSGKLVDMFDLPTPSHSIWGSLFDVDPADFAGWILEQSLAFPDGPYYAWAPGLEMVVIRDTANVEHVLSTNQANFPKGKKFRKNFESFLGEGIFNADGDAWKTHRKAASYMFSTKQLRTQMESVFRASAKQLVAAAQEAAGSGRDVDVQGWMKSLTFDAFCQIAFGRSFEAFSESVNKGQSPEFLQAFDVAQTIGAMRFFVPPIVWKFKLLLGIGTEKPMPGALAKLNPVLNTLVRERVAQPNVEGDDLLSLYIDFARKNEREDMIETEYLKQTSINMLLAGRDTTACLLTNSFRMLSEHPEERALVVAELKRVCAGSVDNVNMKTMGECVVLERFLKEVLRFFPPVGVDGKDALEDDVLPSGILVHKGTFVIYHIQAQCFSEAIWGPDCLEFKPSRFETFSPTNEQFPVFNAGPRLCLGKAMAMLEAKITLATVLLSGLWFSSNDLGRKGVLDRRNLVTATPVQFYRAGLHGHWVVDNELDSSWIKI